MTTAQTAEDQAAEDQAQLIPMGGTPSHSLLLSYLLVTSTILHVTSGPPWSYGCIPIHQNDRGLGAISTGTDKGNTQSEIAVQHLVSAPSHIRIYHVNQTCTTVKNYSLSIHQF